MQSLRGRVLDPGVYSRVKRRERFSGRRWRRHVHNRLTHAADGIEEQPRSSPERIEEDGGDADRHRDHCPDGMNQAGGRKRNAYSIEEESERDVLDHLAIASAANL